MIGRGDDSSTVLSKREDERLVHLVYKTETVENAILISTAYVQRVRSGQRHRCAGVELLVPRHPEPEPRGSQRRCKPRIGGDGSDTVCRGLYGPIPPCSARPHRRRWVYRGSRFRPIAPFSGDLRLPRAVSVTQRCSTGLVGCVTRLVRHLSAPRPPKVPVSSPGVLKRLSEEPPSLRLVASVVKAVVIAPCVIA